MDPLAHTLFGYALAQAGPARRLGRGATLALVAASNLPDVDFFWAVATGTPHFCCRRMLTHSIPVLPVLAAAFAGLLRLRYRELPFRTLFGLSLLGVAGHVLFDSLNSFGVVLLYPFSRARFEIGAVFIVDPILWGLLAAPLLLRLSRSPWIRHERTAKACLASAALYVGVCIALRGRSMACLEGHEREAGRTPAQACVFPEPFGPLLFRGVSREGDLYRISLIHAVPGKVEPKAEVRTEDADARVRSAKETPFGRSLLWFMKAPVWRVDPATGEVRVYDLRFPTVAIKRQWLPFVYRVKPGGVWSVGREGGPPPE